MYTEFRGNLQEGHLSQPAEMGEVFMASQHLGHS